MLPPQPVVQQQQDKGRVRSRVRSQICALVKKDWLLYTRNRKFIFVEIYALLAFFMMNALPSLMTSSTGKPELVPEQLFSTTRTELGNFRPQSRNRYEPNPFDKQLYSPYGIQIAFAPCKNNPVAESVQLAVGAKLNTIKSMNPNSTTVCFDTVDEMQAARSKQRGRFAAMVEIPVEVGKIDATTTAVPYTIFMSKDLVGGVEKVPLPFYGNLGRPYDTTAKKWVTDSSFVRVQYIVQQSIVAYAGSQGGGAQKPSFKAETKNIFIESGPHRSYYTTHETHPISLGSFPLFFLTPVLMGVLRIMQEKGEKLNEHICNSNGVSVSTLGYGKFVFGACHMSFIGILVSFALYFSITNVSFTVNAVFCVVTGVAFNAWKLLYVAFFVDKNKASLGTLVFFLLSMGFSARLRASILGIPMQEGDVLQYFAFLTPAATFYEGLCHMKQFTDDPSVAPLNWSNMNVLPSGQSVLKVGECLLALFLQTLAYLFLAIYSMKTVGGNGSAPKPCCFCLRNSWLRRGGDGDESTFGLRLNRVSSENGKEQNPLQVSFLGSDSHAIQMDLDHGGLVEPMEEIEGGLGIGIEITNLRKEYQSRDKKNSGDVVNAVDGLTVNLRAGEITALLGHNGAGKTTSMQILTGGTNPTSGDAKILGRSIVTDMDMVRKDVGICPQHNVLWDVLTVEEHLQFFADLQREDFTNADLKAVVAKIDLADKARDRAATLSGGMKRKLCIGMALVGNPPVLFLDEPTAGLDPESRRAMWDMLQAEKGSKTIVLCTHHMEEADLLGDRIVVMAHGKLQVAGSSMFLKQKFGIGYKLTVEVTPQESTDYEKSFEYVNKVVRSKLPAAEVNFSTVGNENEAHFDLPMDSTASFPALFSALEKEVTAQNGDVISGFGLTMPSLEEVFLRLADLDSQSVNSTAEEVSSLENLRRGGGLKDHIKSQSFDHAIFSESLPAHRNVGSLKEQLKALVQKRMHSNKRNSIVLKMLLFMPFYYIGFAWLMFVIKSNFKPAVDVFGSETLTMEGLSYGSETWKERSYPSTINVYSDGSNFAGAASEWKTYPASLKQLGNVHVDIVNEMSKTYAGKTAFGKYILEKYSPVPSGGTLREETPMFGAFQFGPENISIIYNSSFVQSPPLLVQWLGTANLRDALGSQANPKLHFVPTLTEVSRMEISQTGAMIRGRISNSIYGTIMGMFLFMALSLGGSVAAIFLVTERIGHIRHQQRMAGVSPFAYLSSTFIVDFLASCPTYIVIAVFITLLGDQAPPVTLFQYIMIGIDSILFSYLLSAMFNDAQVAQSAIMMTNMFSFLGAGVLTTIVSQTNSSMWSTVVEDIFLLLSPGTAMAVGSAKLTTNRINCDIAIGYKLVSECTTETMSVLPAPMNSWKPAGDWEVGGAFTLCIILQLIGFTLLNVVVEYTAVVGTKKRTESSSASLPNVPQLNDEDEDVRRERLRVSATSLDLFSDENHVVCRHLKKNYKIGGICSKDCKLAVDGVSFGVKRGSCLALLGPNGAGKTSMMSMMTGVTIATDGEGYVGGLPVSTSLNEAYKGMGFCPQHGGLFEYLNVDEHLAFYCNVRGMNSRVQKETVDYLMGKLDLRDHSTKLSKELSGGNKRKLSMAISMIGKPDVLLLDEPTAGVDPAIRRSVVEVIHQIKKGASVILTTHIMEEVEALASTVGIMVNGKLSCVGSLNHLVGRFGTYFVMEVRGPAEKWNSIREYIQSTIPTAKLIDRHFGQSTWHLPKFTVKLSSAFDAIEKKKKSLKIVSYAISQLSLEQLFLMFAKKQEQENDTRETEVKRL